MNNGFALRLQSERKKKNMTQEELAEKLNISNKTISKWENGSSIPDILKIKEVAKYFDKPLIYFLGEEHETYNNNLNKRIFIIYTVITIVLLSLIIILLLYSNKYYQTKLYNLSSSNEYLYFKGYYLDSPNNSIIYIDDMKYNKLEEEIYVPKITISIYDYEYNIIDKQEIADGNIKTVNDLLSSSSIQINQRLKSNRIFDSNYQPIIIEIKYDNKIVKSQISIY